MTKFLYAAILASFVLLQNELKGASKPRNSGNFIGENDIDEEDEENEENDGTPEIKKPEIEKPEIKKPEINNQETQTVENLSYETRRRQRAQQRIRGRTDRTTVPPEVGEYPEENGTQPSSFVPGRLWQPSGFTRVYGNQEGYSQDNGQSPGFTGAYGNQERYGNQRGYSPGSTRPNNYMQPSQYLQYPPLDIDNNEAIKTFMGDISFLSFITIDKNKRSSNMYRQTDYQIFIKDEFYKNPFIKALMNNPVFRTDKIVKNEYDLIDLIVAYVNLDNKDNMHTDATKELFSKIMRGLLFAVDINNSPEDVIKAIVREEFRNRSVLLGGTGIGQYTGTLASYLNQYTGLKTPRIKSWKRNKTKTTPETNEEAILRKIEESKTTVTKEEAILRKIKESKTTLGDEEIMREFKENLYYMDRLYTINIIGQQSILPQDFKNFTKENFAVLNKIAIFIFFNFIEINDNKLPCHIISATEENGDIQFYIEPNSDRSKLLRNHQEEIERSSQFQYRSRPGMRPGPMRPFSYS